MNEIPSSGFYARFLGGFSLFYKKEKIIIPKRTRQKSMQLLIMLLMAGKKESPENGWHRCWKESWEDWTIR